MKKIWEAFVSMLLSAIFSLIVGYIIEKIRDGAFNITHKRKFCFICGGTGYMHSTPTFVDGVETPNNKPCKICNKKKFEKAQDANK